MISAPCPHHNLFTATVFREPPIISRLPLATLEFMRSDAAKASCQLLVVQSGTLVVIHPTAGKFPLIIQNALAQDFASVRDQVRRQQNSDAVALRKTLGPLVPKSRLSLFKESGWRMETEWRWSLSDAVVHAFLVALGVLSVPWSRSLDDIDPVEARYVFEERAGIFEYDGGLSRNEAEQRATEWLHAWKQSQLQTPLLLD